GNQLGAFGTVMDDVLDGSQDGLANLLLGSDGDDTLIGAAGDTLKGGKGHDTFNKSNAAGIVTFYGDEAGENGFDIVDYSNQGTGIQINLNLNTQTGGSSTTN